jgi:CD109 antigen
MTRRVSRRAFVKASAVAIAAAATGALAQLFRGGGGSPATSPFVLPTPAQIPRALIDEPVDGYLATAPRVLRAGQRESVALALFQGDRPAGSTVTVTLLRDDAPVAAASGWVAGRGAVPVELPMLARGEYTLRVAAQGFEDQASVQVEDGTLVFVETDKPVYKPGQTVHLRVLALDPTLRPASGEAIVEVMDATGIKVFRKTVAIDDFGMAALDLPLSSEPNLGVWSVQATIGERQGQADVRVERYVLPKYEVGVELAKPWALASEIISGTVVAEYSFGKPVDGEVEIAASRYVGVWEEYARVTQPIDGGRLVFEVPPVGYVAGSPAGGGLAQVRLDVTVREQATGYAETASELVTVAAAPVALRLIPESSTFKPGLSFALLVVSEVPDGGPADADVDLRLYWQDEDYQPVDEEWLEVETLSGLATLRLEPPEDAVLLLVEATTREGAWTMLNLRAGYSPSGTFIHVEQQDRGPLAVGDTARFTVAATREAAHFYYEVLARGAGVLTGVAETDEIALALTPSMAPAARLLVYQILPTGEVAADYLPFDVAGDYPQAVEVRAGREEARPGDELEIEVRAQGPARVGLAAVDRSVFILAENRLNLQQVFDELERLYQAPRAELHEGEPLGGALVEPAPLWFDPFAPTTIPGARELFAEAGVVVLTNRRIPEGKEIQPQIFPMAAAAENVDDDAAAEPLATPAAAAAAPTAAGMLLPEGAQTTPLAEVQRVRQYFPETWIWTDLTTGDDGRAAHTATAPDSITTWMLRAVALSKEHGLGIGEAELRVFQPFFVQVDLPYSAIRGEELPASVALYNYGATAETFTVELEAGDWFAALDERARTVTVEPNEVGAVAFPIRPDTLGVHPLRVTARGQRYADALVKELVVEPEGIARETVDNLVLAPGAARTVDLSVPPDAVDGSARAFVTLTGNVLSQTIEGLDALLQMPFGCGEQNMLLFAPDVFVARYLEETGQLKPEVLAKAELLMLTGYQRELTYRRSDGSFSAFGESDAEGSLWLTAFVLKTFVQARELIYVDDTVLTSARDWIRARENPDGSYDPVGFVHHQELFGGVSGTTALTAFVTIALDEAGGENDADGAVRYLEDVLDQTDDDYALAIVAYALALAGSGRAADAVAALLARARESAEGLHWGEEPMVRADAPWLGPVSTAVETTGYAALALLAAGDNLSAGSALRWLAAQRNSSGGFGSTQDTVVALQAMTSAAAAVRDDIDAGVTLLTGDERIEVNVTPDNAAVLQVVAVPAGGTLAIETRGRGQVMGQAVVRYNLPAVEEAGRSVFQLDVDYGTEDVEVDDTISITATVRFTPPEPLKAGMVVLDIAVPTGFAPVTESIDALVAGEPKLKRWDLAGRKVIFYIEDMLPGEELALTFEARALYPVRAQPVSSLAYAYYRPEWRGESLGGRLTVV